MGIILAKDWNVLGYVLRSGDIRIQVGDQTDKMYGYSMLWGTLCRIFSDATNNWILQSRMH